MSDLRLPVQIGTIEPPNCYVSRDADAVKVTAAQYVTIPGAYVSWVFSSSEPGADDRDKGWGKLDADGNPVQLFKWSVTDGKWLPFVEADIYWSAASGAANAYAVTIPTFAYDSIASWMRFTIFVKINVTNIAGAATLTINSFPAIPIKIGGVDVFAGGLEADRWYTFIFDGTNMEVAGIKKIGTLDIAPGTDGQTLRTRSLTPGPTLTTIWETSVYATASGGEQSIPAAGNSISFTHGLVIDGAAVRPTGGFGAALICVTDDGTYLAGDCIPVESVYYHLTDGDAFLMCWANANFIGVARQNNMPSLDVTTKTGASFQAIDESKWKVVAWGEI